MVALYKDPEGDKVFQGTGMSFSLEKNLGTTDRVTVLEKQVDDLKTQLAKYQVQHFRSCLDLSK